MRFRGRGCSRAPVDVRRIITPVDAAALPRQLAFVVLHPDTPLPSEDEVDAFFCPGFWKGHDFRSWGSNYYFYWNSPGDWYQLDLEKLDETRETTAWLRLGRVRAGDTMTDFPMFEADPVTPYVDRLGAGDYPALPGVDAARGWAFSKLAVSARDEVDVLDFLTTVERFLVRMNGVIVDPAVLTAEQFRRAYLTSE